MLKGVRSSLYFWITACAIGTAWSAGGELKDDAGSADQRTAVSASACTPAPIHIPTYRILVFTRASGRRLYFRFEVSVAEEIKVEVFNAAGDRVARVKRWMAPAIGDIVLDTSRLPAGVYQYRITQGGCSVRSGRVVLRRPH